MQTLSEIYQRQKELHIGEIYLTQENWKRRLWSK